MVQDAKGFIVQTIHRVELAMQVWCWGLERRICPLTRSGREKWRELPSHQVLFLPLPFTSGQKLPI